MIVYDWKTGIFVRCDKEHNWDEHSREFNSSMFSDDKTKEYMLNEVFDFFEGVLRGLRALTISKELDCSKEIEEVKEYQLTVLNLLDTLPRL